ncbi:YwqG family protein [Stenotrophomonas sp.]|uniref:YwqG family protein n=1 Tax=Stenotrophomonas sp. TaxID=69392 RepID=UPI0028AB5F93|nr:YwqG family protein [Stenotrophomonas sp.]
MDSTACSAGSAPCLARTTPHHRPRLRARCCRWSGISCAPPSACSASRGLHAAGSGGEPQLPVGTQWPKGDKGTLDFVARLSLAEMQASLSVPWLPAEGALLFFHGHGGRGRSPKDRANHVVLLVEDLENPQVSTATVGSGRRQRHTGGNVRPVLIQTLPPIDDPLLEPLDLGDEESDAYVELQDVALGDGPRHQFLGYDDPIQYAGMQSDCEAMANGQDDVEPTLAAQRWELLLQLDDDEAIGFSWGDGGRLYFWVEPERAASSDFSNVWRMFQCH